MGLDLLATHGLTLVQAGLSVDERVGFLLGLEFAGAKLTPDALAARVRYYRNEVHSAISQALREQAARANALDAQNTPDPTKTRVQGPKASRSEILHEINQLQKRCERLRTSNDEHAVDNLILAGNRIATLKRQLEKL